jgi:hypothetical protein
MNSVPSSKDRNTYKDTIVPQLQLGASDALQSILVRVRVVDSECSAENRKVARETER